MSYLDAARIALDQEKAAEQTEVARRDEVIRQETYGAKAEASRLWQEVTGEYTHPESWQVTRGGEKIPTSIYVVGQCLDGLYVRAYVKSMSRYHVTTLEPGALVADCRAVSSQGPDSLWIKTLADVMRARERAGLK